MAAETVVGENRSYPVFEKLRCAGIHRLCGDRLKGGGQEPPQNNELFETHKSGPRIVGVQTKCRRCEEQAGLGPVAAKPTRRGWRKLLLGSYHIRAAPDRSTRSWPPQLGSRMLQTPPPDPSRDGYPD